jgi:hypothetical protein
MRVRVRVRVRVSRVTESANALPRYLATLSPTLGDSAVTHGKHSFQLSLENLFSRFIFNIYNEIHFTMDAQSYIESQETEIE